MKFPIIILGGLLSWLGTQASQSVDPQTMRSRSGQFVVRGLPVGSGAMLTTPAAGVSYVRLDPAVLAVSCERVKQQILAELELPDTWRGTIQIETHPIVRDNEPIVITSVHYADGWGYHLKMPELVGRGRLEKALVQVILAEVANRRAKQRPAELPAWLVEGMTAQVQSEGGAALMLQPATRVVSRAIENDPLKPVREILRHRPGLTFDEFSWPGDEQLREGNLELYHRCAQLFVYELMRLKQGKACLRDMLQRLPENLNWQTTFLQAFQAHFGRLVDVAKWWSLCLVNVTAHDPNSAWPLQETWQQLQELLTTAAQVRRGPRELPQSTRVSLQNIISEWPYSQQGPVLAQKINHLQALRLRASPELLKLIDGYVQVLGTYVEKEGLPGRRRSSKPPGPPDLIASEALQRLAELDAQREALRQQANLSAGPQLGSTR